MRGHSWPARSILSCLACLVVGGAWAAAAHIRVSQRDQAFNPTSLAVQRGTVLDIVNDDGDVLHHAYIESPAFKFDSGDQEPGATASIAFTVPGSFVVLCGIHPKMKLKVHVE